MERGARERKRDREREANSWKVAFSNIAGLNNKDKDVWENIRKWGMMVMMETWVEKK